MEWILHNLESLIPIILFLIFIFGGRKKEEEQAPQDSEAMERARRVQEEIRRKILERQRGETPAQQPTVQVYEEEPQEEEPTLRPTQHREERPVAPPVVETYQRPQPSYTPPARDDHMRLIEEQRKQVEEELQKARELRDKAMQAPKVDRHFPEEDDAVLMSRLREDIARDLRDKDSFRKAIVLREILDTPVGLR